MSKSSGVELASINLMLNSLASDLDHDICEALTDGNNGLAERLNLHLVHARKVANALHGLASRLN